MAWVGGRPVGGIGPQALIRPIRLDPVVRPFINAFAHVQGAGNNIASAGTTVNITLPAAPLTGNLVIVGVASTAEISGSLTIVDTNGNAYTLAGTHATSAAGNAYIGYLLIAPGNASKTITLTFATSTVEAWAEEFYPADGTVAAFDAVTIATGTGTGTTINTPSIVPTYPNSLAFAVATEAASISAPTAGQNLAGWTGAAGGILAGDAAEYRISTSTSTPVQWTTASGAWSAIAAAFYNVPVLRSSIYGTASSDNSSLDGMAPLDSDISASAVVAASLDGAGVLLSDILSATSSVVAPLVGAGTLADIITGSAVIAAPLIASGALLSSLTGASSLAIIPWSFVSRAAGVGTGTATAAFSPSTTAGNILLALMRFPASSTFTSLGDSVNTWTLVGTEAVTDASTNKYRLYMAKAVGGASTVSAVASAGSVTVGIMEFGVAGDWSLVAFSQTPDSQISATTWGTFNSAINVGNHDLLVAFMSQDAARTANSPDNQGNTVTTFTVNTIFEAHNLNTTLGSTSETGSYAASGTRAIQFLLDFQLSVDAALTGFASISALLKGAGGLADIIAGTATVVAPLTGAGALADVIAGRAVVVAPLIGAGALADVITGSAAVAALMKGTGALADVITASASVVAPLVGAGTLADVIVGAASVAAPLVAAGALADIIAGAATVSAPGTGSGALADIIAGSASVTPPATGKGELDDAIAGTCVIVANITLPGATSNILGAATLTALLSAVGTLTDDITGSAVVTAPGTGTGALADIILGTSAAATPGTGTGALADTIFATSVLTALPFEPSTMAGAIAGIGVVTATLGEMVFITSSVQGVSGMRAGIIDSLIVDCLELCELVLSVVPDIAAPPNSEVALRVNDEIITSCIKALTDLVEVVSQVSISARQFAALNTIFQAIQATRVLLQLASYLTPGTSPDALWVHTKITLQSSYDQLFHNYGQLISLDSAAAGVN